MGFIYLGASLFDPNWALTLSDYKITHALSIVPTGHDDRAHFVDPKYESIVFLFNTRAFVFNVVSIDQYFGLGSYFESINSWLIQVGTSGGTAIICCPANRAY